MGSPWSGRRTAASPLQTSQRAARKGTGERTLWDRLAAIRDGERPTVRAAFATLFGVLVGHSLLETARDALFLTELPARRLPWIYLAIALLTVLLTSKRGGRLLAGRSPRALSSWLVCAAAVTLGLSAALGITSRPWIFYALYIWAGLTTTLLVVRLWSLLGDRFDESQARRLFGPIGAGAILGAVVGSGLARLMVEVVDARALPIAAAAAFACAAVGSLQLRQAEPSSQSAGGRARSPAEEVTEHALGNERAIRVVLLVLVSTVALTLVDYAFKSTAVELVARERLDVFFANVYLALNLIALVLQILLVGPILRRSGPVQALAVLPILLCLGSTALLLGGGLAVAMLIKVAQGVLHHSLHRTAVEVLLVPISDEKRLGAMASVEAFGQRGGQALAAVLILATETVGADPSTRGVTLLVLSLFWIGLVADLRLNRTPEPVRLPSSRPFASAGARESRYARHDPRRVRGAFASVPWAARTPCEPGTAGPPPDRTRGSPTPPAHPPTRARTARRGADRGAAPSVPRRSRPGPRRSRSRRHPRG